METTGKMAAVSTVVDAEVVATGADTEVAVAEVVEVEMVQDLTPVIVRAGIQLILPSRDESIRILQLSVDKIQSTLHIQTQIMNAIQDVESLEVLKDIRHKLDVHILEQTIEWTTLSIISEKKGLTKDAIRKQLQGGDFEEGVDFKSDGNKIIVHQGAIGRIQRKRRSSNG